MGAKNAKERERIVTMSDVLTAFSEHERYRARLDYIAERVNSVTHAWSRLDLSDTHTTLGMLQELAEHAVVPPGCKTAQETLMCAMRCYYKAMQGLDLAKLTSNRAEYEAAWGHVRDGDVLLALAIELAGEA
jgi:hypothetical protein